jgi:hypothetical protein
MLFYRELYLEKKFTDKKKIIIIFLIMISMDLFKEAEKELDKKLDSMSKEDLKSIHEYLANMTEDDKQALVEEIKQELLAELGF